MLDDFLAKWKLLKLTYRKKILDKHHRSNWECFKDPTAEKAQRLNRFICLTINELILKLFYFRQKEKYSWCVFFFNSLRYNSYTI